MICFTPRASVSYSTLIFGEHKNNFAVFADKCGATQNIPIYSDGNLNCNIFAIRNLCVPFA